MEKLQVFFIARPYCLNTVHFSTLETVL